MDFIDTTAIRIAARKEDNDAEAIKEMCYLLPAFLYLKRYSEEMHAGEYVMVSREWERTMSLRRDQIIGQTDYKFLPHREADKIRLNEQHTLEFEKIMTVSDAVGNRYTGWKPLRMSLIPLKVGGNKFNYIAGMASLDYAVAYDK